MKKFAISVSILTGMTMVYSAITVWFTQMYILLLDKIDDVIGKVAYAFMWICGIMCEVFALWGVIAVFVQICKKWAPWLLKKKA